MIEKRTLDSVVAALFIAIGIAQLWGGYTMDRLEIRQIHPASIPGLVPMILGVVMAILGAIVLYTSLRSVPDADDPDAAISGGEIRSFVWVAVVCGIYALGLVSRVHFWPASALFVFAFIIIAEWPRLRAGDTRRRVVTILMALAVAVIVTGGISYLFEEGFLVRLP